MVFAHLRLTARNLRSLRETCVAPERLDREDQPIEVIVDVEIARKARAGVLRLVPVAVSALRLREPFDRALDAAPPLARGEQREQRPRGLRCGRIAEPGRALGCVRAQIL